MTKPVLAVVNFPARSGIHADATQNSFAFLRDGLVIEEEIDAIRVLLDAFYNASQSTQVSISDFFSSSMKHGTDAATITFYEPNLGQIAGRDIGVVGPPLTTRRMNVEGSGTSNDNLPSELAVCASFHAVTTGLSEQVGNVRPAARRRGRIYLGPLSAPQTTFTDTDTGRVAVASAFRATINEAMSQLAGHSPLWCVWSRADGNFYQVVGGHVDDAFDVQRRRGEAPTVRHVWP